MLSSCLKLHNIEARQMSQGQLLPPEDVHARGKCDSGTNNSSPPPPLSCRASYPRPPWSDRAWTVPQAWNPPPSARRMTCIWRDMRIWGNAIVHKIRNRKDQRCEYAGTEYNGVEADRCHSLPFWANIRSGNITRQQCISEPWVRIVSWHLVIRHQMVRHRLDKINVGCC